MEFAQIESQWFQGQLEPPIKKRNFQCMTQKRSQKRVRLLSDISIAKYPLNVLQARWAGERCAVCDSDVDTDYDQLVGCDQCGITVHQTCYGVTDLPGEDDLWLCRVCEHKVNPAE